MASMKTKALVWVSILFLVVLMLIPLLHQSSQSQSHTYFEEGRRKVGALKRKASSNKGTELMKLMRLRKAMNVVDEQASARAVPTGPDPLHHNSNPTSTSTSSCRP